MSKNNEIVLLKNIQKRIHTIRGLQVMLDSDLAEIYGVENKRLNEQVKRNIERFPERFRFQLSFEEKDELVANSDQFNVSIEGSLILKSQIATSSTSGHGGRRTLPIEQKQLITDTKLDKVLDAIELNEIKPKQGIFYEGQIFDAYRLVSDIVRTANKSIIVIDNYINDTTLQLFTKINSGVKVKLYTKIISKSLKQDISKYNSQYEKIEIHKLHTSHDRFMIIDNKIVYHFGASLKDLGKKWFAFSKLEMEAKDLIERLGK